MNPRLPRQPGIKTESHDLNLAYVKGWRKRLRNTVKIALEMDGASGSKVKIENEGERANLQWAAGSLHSIDEMLAIIKVMPSRLDRARALGSLCRVIGASFAIGSHASVSQTQRVFQHKTAQGKGGKASGVARAVRPWHKPAQEMAIKKRKANPRLSSAQISTDICTDVPGAPKDPRQIRSFLAAIEKAGDLPPRRT